MSGDEEDMRGREEADLRGSGGRRGEGEERGRAGEIRKGRI